MTPAPQRNLTVAAAVGAFAIGILGLSFAAAPFYSAFCRATGFAGTTQRVEAASGARGQRTIKVRFDANVAPGLDWEFAPETPAVALRTGATATVFFRFRNRIDREVAANAVYNVTPEISGAYFDKVSCFCFTEQRLGP